MTTVRNRLVFRENMLEMSADIRHTDIDYSNSEKASLSIIALVCRYPITHLINPSTYSTPLNLITNLRLTFHTANSHPTGDPRVSNISRPLWREGKLFERRKTVREVGLCQNVGSDRK